jgi:PHD/YefM family antitoxin component YafN of YafNO toxin-antitoxin module
MNSISIAEIKRGGMDALDAALHRGPTVILKRNRAAAVVLTPDAYASLVAKAQQSATTGSALDWLLQVPVADQVGLLGEAMTQRLMELKADWTER